MSSEVFKFSSNQDFKSILIKITFVLISFPRDFSFTILVIFVLSIQST